MTIFGNGQAERWCCLTKLISNAARKSIVDLDHISNPNRPHLTKLRLGYQNPSDRGSVRVELRRVQGLEPCQDNQAHRIRRLNLQNIQTPFRTQVLPIRSIPQSKLQTRSGSVEFYPQGAEQQNERWFDDHLFCPVCASVNTTR